MRPRVQDPRLRAYERRPRFVCVSSQGDRSGRGPNESLPPAPQTTGVFAQKGTDEVVYTRSSKRLVSNVRGGYSRCIATIDVPTIAAPVPAIGE